MGTMVNINDTFYDSPAKTFVFSRKKPLHRGDKLFPLTATGYLLVVFKQIKRLIKGSS